LHHDPGKKRSQGFPGDLGAGVSRENRSKVVGREAEKGGVVDQPHTAPPEFTEAVTGDREQRYLRDNLHISPSFPQSTEATLPAAGA